MDDRQEKQTHILILSSWRSGSSFLGQIFNHHPNVFYVYEPARMVWVKFPQEKASLLHYPVRDLLHSLFTCDTSPLHDYLPQNGRYISNLPFWSESRALCSPPACKAFSMDTEFDRPSCFQRCGYVPLEKMTQACKVHKHVVLKTVRVLDLGVLLPLLQDAKLDLRIVHLVRDPRAVAFSRLNFNHLRNEDLIVLRDTKNWKEKTGTPNVTNVMAKICSAQVGIKEFGEKDDISRQGFYMMVRHEDLSINPLSTVEKIFSFAGLSLTGRFKDWLHNVTHKSQPKQAGFMKFAEDSKKVIQKWRGGLQHSVVLEIQEQCQKAMEVFGYRPVRTLKEQRDLNFNVMTENNN
ncbi:PREDICTED: carbohydrate sulfotransferase 5-like [Nanorana parkeri]|uniref:carbohydrate sulfotransferase 5-like n=1 Tax=Nanorana parkeri TaxID=125878 RepID=UPI0008542ABD|nr:PREDICTED: carbohydrate sulfotransferase 5-like [Nanorana parkeri]